MTDPRVAIVMPTYNSVRHLKSTVESVIAQTFSDWELVLFDDGSSDGTVALTRELAGHDHRIRPASGAHGGVAVARNEGLRRTSPGAEYVTFLDSDDTWMPEALAILVAALDARPECSMVHAVARATDMDGKQFEGDDLADKMRHRRRLDGDELVELPISAPTTFAAMLVDNWIVTPGTSLIRRSALERVGGVDPATAPADDWDLNIRLARTGDFALVDETILNWRRHPGSLSNTDTRQARAYVIVRGRTIRSAENTPEQRRDAWAILHRECRHARHRVVDGIKRRDARGTARDLAYAIALHVESARCRLTTR